MKILYLHQYFVTPAQPGATRSYWIAQELISQGHKVTMISGNQNITQRKESTNVDGINVIYLKVPYDNKMGIPQRLISFLKFMCRSMIEALRQKEVDMIIATSTPLTIGFPALVLNRFKKIPYLFEVRDLWPEVPIQMGGLRNPVLKKLAFAFEKQIYKKAKHIVALSPGMRDGVISAGTPPEKVSMIPNMAKIDKFWPRKKNREISQKFGLRNDSFKVVHFGSMGHVNGLDNFVNASQIAKSKGLDDIDFILIGQGLMKEKYEKIKMQENLYNLIIHEPVPLDIISELVNLCDVSYFGVSQYPILKINSANKFFDSLSAGKPLIINFDGWMKELIENYECGIMVHPTDANDLLDKINYLKENPDKTMAMAQNARRLAETKYDKSILCKEFAEIINSKFSK